MSLLRQHVRGAARSLFPSCLLSHSPSHVRRTVHTKDVAQNASQTRPTHPRVVFSGIQPTGMPHLGNMLGALMNWVKLQREAAPEDKLIFSIVGWHALTLPQDPKELSAARREILAVLLACGIDPKRSIVFHQDENRHHAELAWILNCITPMGKLHRMTTWKSRLAASRNARDDSEVDESLLNVGLFTYPVLQAADILAYKTTHVPVGEDQQQHIELCRDLAVTFNKTFKGGKDDPPVFPLPRHVIPSTSCRVLSLKDPSSKMSKSSPDVNSRILLTDSAEQINKKIRRAVTDSITGISYDSDTRPGIANLVDILAACEDAKPQDVAVRYANRSHAEFKMDVAEAVEGLMSGPRREFERLRRDIAYLDSVSKSGAARAMEITEKTIDEVRKRTGLY
ncbi:tryptophanyl-tRNA synthetase [Epithele typhae]|uniref:tryptophanyl-tRNA synthetase n=1 Tax=Epithele typhae TaxID=378194 RepID=UPI0020087FD1|nr:tryptophanyl-tRNA synthetase [Epithele typhae]KAH9915239.1 tryptophanyl-tRNA synthetase [Epithele typhae]